MALRSNYAWKAISSNEKDLHYHMKSSGHCRRKLQPGTVIRIFGPDEPGEAGAAARRVIYWFLEWITCTRIFGKSASVAQQWRWPEESMIMLIYL